MGCYYMTPGKGEGHDLPPRSPRCTWPIARRKVDTHARIKVSCLPTRRLKGEGAETHATGKLLATTVGRVLFNDICPTACRSTTSRCGTSDLANVISDCYLELGRRETIALLDRMKEIGFQFSTRSGLSFATDDLKTPPNKAQVIGDAEKSVLKIQKLYAAGIITDGERYNQVLDTWTHAREQITTEMMTELEHDVREDGAT